MGLDPLRLSEHLHGHVGWLAAALLVHPAIVLRRPSRRAPWAVGLSVAFVTAAAAVGVWLYDPYRAKLRQGIFRDARGVGLLFERKEHLAFAAVLLAWAGAAAYFAAPRAAPAAGEALRKVAARAFLASAAIAIAVAALGTVVASFRSF